MNMDLTFDLTACKVSSVQIASRLERKGGEDSETSAKMFKADKVYQTIPCCGDEIISSSNSFWCLMLA